MTMVWFLSHSVRALAEKRAVEQLEKSNEWLNAVSFKIVDGQLIVDFDMTVDPETLEARLTFPNHYPDLPPWIRPRDGKARWSKHQFGDGGSLCLQFRPDTWHPDFNSAAVMQSAFDLLTAEFEGTAPVPDGHFETFPERLRKKVSRLFISEGCLARIRFGTSQGASVLTWYVPGPFLSSYVGDEEDKAAKAGPSDDWRLGIRAEHLTIAAKGIVAPASRPSNHTELFIAAGIAESDHPEAGDGARKRVVLFPHQDPPIAWLLWKDDDVWDVEVVTLHADEGSRTGANRTQRSVAIVGCGSLGSKVAESLTRSGVGKLILVDGDVFFPGNIVRHVLTWTDVGGGKAEAVAQRLLAVTPKASVHTIPVNLNWQGSPRILDFWVNQLCSADLIIDATADPATTRMLASSAHLHSKPFLTATIFEGGIGCRISTVIAGRDPLFPLSLAAYRNWLEEQATAPRESVPVPYGGADETGQIIVADDASVSLASGFASRMALDILDGNVPDSDKAWLLVGFQKKWIFGGLGHTINFEPKVSTTQVSDEPDQDATAFIVELLKDIDFAPNPAS